MQLLNWIKAKLFGETATPVDISPSRGVPLVKKAPAAAADPVVTEAVVEVAPEPVAVETPVVETLATPAEQPVVMAEPPVIPSIIEPVVADVAQVSSCQQAVDCMPEDSVLRRHYQAQQAAERAAITEPYPTDSILRRHRQSLAQATLNPPAAVTSSAPVASQAPEPVAVSAAAPVAAVPEDSILKRHYLHMQQA